VIPAEVVGRSQPASGGFDNERTRSTAVGCQIRWPTLPRVGSSGSQADNHPSKNTGGAVFHSLEVLLSAGDGARLLEIPFCTSVKAA